MLTEHRDGTFTYTAEKSYVGTDTFTDTPSDQRGPTSTGSCRCWSRRWAASAAAWTRPWPTPATTRSPTTATPATAAACGRTCPQHGRPRKDGKPPSGRWRRVMARRLATWLGRFLAGYGQRWQVATGMSMLKRR